MRKVVLLLPVLMCMPLGLRAAEPPTTNVLRVVVEKQTIAALTKKMGKNGMPLVPLRAISESAGAALRWDKARQQATVTHKGSAHVLKGELRFGTLLVAPEEAARVLGLKLAYDAELSAVVFSRGKPPEGEALKELLPRYETYTKDDVYWLARIVEAEARGEPYESRLAVASVVLNRVAAPQYPDTVQGVVFDKKHGVQFTPTVNGAIKRAPSTLSYLAALDALDGFNNAPGALFFLAPKLATNFWVQKNRQFAFTIGGHAYYY